jgi:hypothetical protein
MWFCLQYPHQEKTLRRQFLFLFYTLEVVFGIFLHVTQCWVYLGYVLVCFLLL